MRFDEHRLRANARRFASERFRGEMTDLLREHAGQEARR
jgi:hypothetical protein